MWYLIRVCTVCKDKKSSGAEIYLNLESLTCIPLICTINCQRTLWQYLLLNLQVQITEILAETAIVSTRAWEMDFLFLKEMSNNVICP